MIKIKNHAILVCFLILILATIILSFEVYSKVVGIIYSACILLLLFLCYRRSNVARVLLFLMLLFIGLNFVMFILWGISEVNIVE
ncbi:MAG TPA: hypothetical protein VF941_20145, partial [Clostridia bacterium]